MAEADVTAKGGAGKWTKTVLVLSLTLNLLVVGMIAGAVTGRHWHGDGQRVRNVGFGPFTEALTARDQGALRDAFLAAAPDMGNLREERSQDMAAFLTVLRTEPWDGAAAEALLAKQGAKMTERLALGRKLLIERIAAMTPEARVAFAARVEETAARPWRSRFGRN